MINVITSVNQRLMLLIAFQSNPYSIVINYHKEIQILIYKK
ncbi:MAG: hypothetical protein BAJALOKI2v1_980004 [Promethearchaeota archaeon]|nr:MAG: hypothetical protein BAJALOKI2v1_980004 [Candidatus Lokiarchaeota archaeon]